MSFVIRMSFCIQIKLLINSVQQLTSAAHGNVERYVSEDAGSELYGALSSVCVEACSSLIQTYQTVKSCIGPA